MIADGDDREDARFDAATGEITAEDVANAMDMRWWCYRLRFERPVHVTPVICELTRGRDGQWVHHELGSPVVDWTKTYREIEIKLVLPETRDGKRYFLTAGDLKSWGYLKKVPEFASFRFSAPTKIGDDFLALSWREKDPSRLTGREENMVQAFGIHVLTGLGVHP